MTDGAKPAGPIMPNLRPFAPHFFHAPDFYRHG